jgi:hypothetical protein
MIVHLIIVNVPTEEANDNETVNHCDIIPRALNL